MSKLLPTRGMAALSASVLSAFIFALSAASAASAFTESYGFYEVGNGGYVQSAAAHTFFYNDGAAQRGGTLACQLFNHSGVNNVEHGSGSCTVLYGGGAFVWARVYNEAGFSQVIGGEAGTGALAPAGASADGLDPAGAKYLFTLADGVPVGIVENSLAKCLIRTVGERSGEVCAGTVAIAEGHGISVGDECGSSGRNLMEIVGLAPEGAANARLRSSDGTSQTTPVLHGAFRFDGANPAAGGPHPTGVEWVAASGEMLGNARLPVQDEPFCLET